MSTQRVDLRETVATEAQHTAALAEVIMRLAEEGHVRGWRDERFAVSTGWGTPTLALIERAATRFSSTRTYTAHMNGLIAGADSVGPVLWLARRAEARPIDPDMQDSFVAGGIDHDFDTCGALEEECWEEAGIGADLVAQLVPRGTLDVLREMPEGIQCETLFTFDLALPDSFIPANQGEEVAGHLHASPNTALDIMTDFVMTVDATLVTLDALARPSSALVPQGFAPGNTI